MTASRTELLKEAGRKAFHLLTLVYLAAYHWLPGVLLWLGLWTMIVATFEFSRIRIPAMNHALTRWFRPIMREEEMRQVSGMLHTTSGAWITIAVWGNQPLVVTGALLNLAFGDAAAALAGRAFGRRKFAWRGKTKSLEGSAACLLVCFGACVAAGVPWQAALAGAVAATVVEAFPMGLDDNALLPVASAAALAFASK